jgi:phosphoribosyl 1,2-cyclic phosphodiesterase
MAVKDDEADRATNLVPPLRAGAHLCVLGSGSSGNCSVLIVDGGPRRRAWLIDAGFSPRRTRTLLKRVGISLDEVEGVLLTHLDHDHWYAGWCKALPPAARVHLHKSHVAQELRLNGAARRAEGFHHDFDLAPGVRVSPIMLSHDESGTAAFRFSFSGQGLPASLGFATDLGRATPGFVEHFTDVDVLAIESNYCPKMQLASFRPPFLKHRIMGGKGHLSNHQAAEAVAQIGPREHVVFLHLSRQCNRPDLVAALHGQAGYTFTISQQTCPTPWVAIRGGGPVRPRVRVEAHLWSNLDPQPVHISGGA